MRRSSHNTARRIILTGTAALSFTAMAVALTLSEAGAATNISGRELAPAAAARPPERSWRWTGTPRPEVLQ